MLVTIHQPEHLPWLGFFDKLRQAELFVLLDTCQFAKDDFQNRNRIKTGAGPAWLTVPVYKAGRSEQRIDEVAICNDRAWGRQHWAQLGAAYADAPHFAAHRPFFAELYGRAWASLAELNLALITYLAEQLGLGGRFVRASELGISERGPTRVNLSICRAVGATAYLSGQAGRSYLDEAQFAEHGIAVRYQEFRHPVYEQLWGEFRPAMSAVDLLFNHGPASLAILADANAHAASAAATPAAV
jgi:hypothetical protein